MEDLKIIVAKNISAYRKKAGLTQIELAEKLNYSDKAISKWERGDSLPDIAVLKDISNLFNISLDTLTSNIVEKPIIKPKKRNIFESKKVFISSCASIIVWLVAIVAFVFGYIFLKTPELWIVFIYALAVNCIVLLALKSFWKSNLYDFFVVSGLIIFTILSIFLSFNVQNFWLLFFIALPLIALAYLWYIARNITIHKKNISKTNNKDN